MSKHRRRSGRKNNRLTLERLEDRKLLVIGAFDVPSGIAPGDTITSGGDDFDGVVDLNGSCTGSLVDRAQFNATDVGGRHILTAAHCVAGEGRQRIVHNETGTARFEFTGRDNPGTPGGAVVTRTTGVIDLATASAADLQTELESLSNIGTGNVEVSGDDGDWRLEFRGDLDYEPIAELQEVNLTGGATVTVSTQSVGGPDARAEVSFYIRPEDFYDSGQVRDIRRVTIGGDVVVHPDYNGDTADGNDVAVIYLDEVAPHNATGYDIRTTSGEDNDPMRVIGYGRTGTGTIGAGRFPDLTEIQRIAVDASGGDFRLEFNGSTTGLLDAGSVSPTDIENALEALADIDDVVVREAGGAGNPHGGDFEVRWVAVADALSSSNLPEMGVVDVSLTGGNVTITTLHDNANVEHQRLTLNASAGTFNLQLDVDNDGTPESSASLPFNAGAAAIETALEGFSELDEVSVFNSSTGANNFDIVFNAADSSLGLDLSTLTVDTGSLVGTAFVRTVQDGSRDTKRLGTNTFNGIAGNGNLTIEFNTGTASEGFPGPGDSGGPGFLVDGGNLTIAGVVSNGGQTFGSTEEYARVSDFDNWIEDHVTDSVRGAYDLVLNLAGHAVGNNGESDTILARVVSGALELLVDGTVYYRDLLTSISSLSIIGSQDDEAFSVDLSSGNWIPAGGISIHGGNGIESVRVDGNGSLLTRYTTDPFSSDSAQFTIGARTISLMEVNAAVAHDLAGLIFRTGNDADDLDVNDVGNRSRVTGISGGTNILPLLFFDIPNVTFDLSTNDAPGAAFDVIQFHSLGALNLQNLTVNTGDGEDRIDLLANSSAAVLRLNGGSRSDAFNIGNGDLDAVAGVIFVDAGSGANDRIFLNDSGNDKLVNYKVTPTKITSEFANGDPRVFNSVNFDGSAERVTIDGTDATNEFNVTPSSKTTFKINGNLPAQPVPPNEGDLLEIEFAGTTQRKLSFTDRDAGNGMWEFGNRRDVEFMGIERFNFFEILVTGSEQGRRGRPVFKVFDAELGDLVLDTTVAYAPVSRTGVRVSSGDLNGDGIPEIVTAPGRSQRPIVKAFDILTGQRLPEFFFRAYAATYEGGTMVAVGDVTGDGLNDIVTSPSRGVSFVRVFENQLVSHPNKAFANRPTKQFRAFGRNFIGGSSVALADMNGDNRDDVVVGSGTGTRARVQIWDASPARPTLMRTFLALDASRNSRGGISVATGRVNGDATSDIIIGDDRRGLSRVEVLDGQNGNVLSAFTPYPGANAEIRVAARDFDGDGIIDSIFAGQGTDGEEHRVDRFLTNGTEEAIDFNFAGDLDFVDGGFFLG